MTPPTPPPPRKPGRIFWLGTFIVGIVSPGKGKRRINRRMRELHQYNQHLLRRNSESVSEVKYLREELRRVAGENALYALQDDINLNVVHESQFAPENLPVGKTAETTMPLQTIHQPLAKG